MEELRTETKVSAIFPPHGESKDQMVSKQSKVFESNSKESGDLVEGGAGNILRRRSVHRPRRTSFKHEYPKRVSLRSSSELAMALKACSSNHTRRGQRQGHSHRFPQFPGLQHAPDRKVKGGRGEVRTMMNLLNERMFRSPVLNSHSNPTQASNTKPPNPATCAWRQSQVRREFKSALPASRHRQRSLTPPNAHSTSLNSYRSRSPLARVRWKSPAIPAPQLQRHLHKQQTQDPHELGNENEDSELKDDASTQGKSPTNIFRPCTGRGTTCPRSHFTATPNSRGEFKTFRFQNKNDSRKDCGLRTCLLGDRRNGSSSPKPMNKEVVEEQVKEKHVPFSSSPNQTTCQQKQEKQFQNDSSVALNSAPFVMPNYSGNSTVAPFFHTHNVHHVESEWIKEPPLPPTLSQGFTFKHNPTSLPHDPEQHLHLPTHDSDADFIEMEKLTADPQFPRNSHLLTNIKSSDNCSNDAPADPVFNLDAETLVGTSQRQNPKRHWTFVEQVGAQEKSASVSVACNTGEFLDDSKVEILERLCKANAKIRRLELLKRFTDLELETLRLDLSGAKKMLGVQSAKLEQLKPDEGPPWIVPSDENNNNSLGNPDVDYFAFRTCIGHPNATFTPGQIYHAQAIPSFKTKFPPRTIPRPKVIPKPRAQIPNKILHKDQDVSGKLKCEQPPSHVCANPETFKPTATTTTTPLRLRTNSAPPGKTYLNIYQRKLERERTFQVQSSRSRNSTARPKLKQENEKPLPLPQPHTKTRSYLARNSKLPKALQFLKSKSKVSDRKRAETEKVREDSICISSQPTPTPAPEFGVDATEQHIPPVISNSNSHLFSRARSMPGKCELSRAPLVKDSPTEHREFVRDCDEEKGEGATEKSTKSGTRPEYLAIAVASREGLLREIQHSIRKGKKILQLRFNALISSSEASVNDLHFLLTSHRRFIRWLHNYVNYSLTLIARFDDKYMKSSNFFVPATITLQPRQSQTQREGVRIKGIFIPVPEQQSKKQNASPPNPLTSTSATCEHLKKPPIPPKKSLETQTEPERLLERKEAATCSLEIQREKRNIGTQKESKARIQQHFGHNFNTVFLQPQGQIKFLSDATNNTDHDPILLNNHQTNDSKTIQNIPIEVLKFFQIIPIISKQSFPKSKSRVDVDSSNENGGPDQIQLQNQQEFQGKKKSSNSNSESTCKSIPFLDSNLNSAPNSKLESGKEFEGVFPARAESSCGRNVVLAELAETPRCSTSDPLLKRLFPDSSTHKSHDDFNCSNSVAVSALASDSMESIHGSTSRSKPRITLHTNHLQSHDDDGAKEDGKRQDVLVHHALDMEAEDEKGAERKRRRSGCAANFQLAPVPHSNLDHAVVENTTFNHNSSTYESHTNLVEDDLSQLSNLLAQLHQQPHANQNRSDANFKLPQIPIEHERIIQDDDFKLEFKLSENRCECEEAARENEMLGDNANERVGGVDLKESGKGEENPEALTVDGKMLWTCSSESVVEDADDEGPRSIPSLSLLSPLDFLDPKDLATAQRFYNHKGNDDMRTLDPLQYFPLGLDNGCPVCRKKQQDLIRCKCTPRPKTPTVQEFTTFFHHTVKKYKETQGQGKCGEFKSAAQVVLEILDEKNKNLQEIHVTAPEKTASRICANFENSNCNNSHEIQRLPGQGQVRGAIPSSIDPLHVNPHDPRKLLVVDNEPRSTTFIPKFITLELDGRKEKNRPPRPSSARRKSQEPTQRKGGHVASLQRPKTVSEGKSEKASVDSVRVRPASATSATKRSRLPVPVTASAEPSKPHTRIPITSKVVCAQKEKEPEKNLESNPKSSVSLKGSALKLEGKTSKSKFIASKIAKVGEKMRRSLIPVTTGKRAKGVGGSERVAALPVAENVLRQIPVKRQLKKLRRNSLTSLQTNEAKSMSSSQNLRIGETNLHKVQKVKNPNTT